MPITTAPALLIGLGARLILDHYNRLEGSSSMKDFILLGTWQGVALHYATKNSGTSGFGAIVAFGIATKLFIEFNLDSDTLKCLSTILGVALGVLFTDFLSQYFDKPPKESSRKKSTTTANPTSTPKRRRERPPHQSHSRRSTMESRAAAAEISVEITSSSIPFSDITSVDSNSDRVGPTSSLSPLEREVHVLRTRAALADSERRRCKEERKWALSQGNPARASQMKWEVKRYTALMETFNREADEKAAEIQNTPRPSQPAEVKKLPPSRDPTPQRQLDKLSSNTRHAQRIPPIATNPKRPPTTQRDPNG